MWTALAAAAMSAAGEASKGSAAAPAMTGDFDGRDTINMAPGTNAGEMLKVATGPTTNGGYGAPQSRYASNGSPSPSLADSVGNGGGGLPIGPALLIGGAALAAYMVAR